MASTAGVYPKVRKSCAASGCGKPLTGRQRTCCSNACWQQYHRDKKKAASVTTVPRVIRLEWDRIARLAAEVKVKQAAKRFNPDHRDPLPQTIRVGGNGQEHEQGPWGIKRQWLTVRELIAREGAERFDLLYFGN